MLTCVYLSINESATACNLGLSGYSTAQKRFALISIEIIRN